MAGPIQQKASPSQASRTFARPTGNLSTAGMPTKQQIDAIVGAAETSKPQDRVEIGASRDSGVDAMEKLRALARRNGMPAPGDLSTAGLPTRQDVDALVRAEQRSERVGAKVSALIDG